MPSGSSPRRSTRLRSLLLCCALGSGALSFGALSFGAASTARANAATPGAAPSAESTFQQAAQALKQGSYSDAIEWLEQLSDRGVVRAALSHNRALAYLLRAQSPKSKPGDLGQAAAALQETLRLDPDHTQAEHALLEVQREIARKRSQRGQDPVIVDAPLMDAVLGLLPANVWAGATLLGSLLLALGLVLRQKPAHSPARLSGQVSVALGLGFIALFGSLSAASDNARRTRREAVIVVAEAPLLDALGKPAKTQALGTEANAIPEGASVFVLAERDRLAQVLWGNTEVWVQRHSVRVLAQP